MREQLVQIVQARRRRLGWTQIELARCLGSSPSRVCKLEAGDRTVSLDLLARALRAMEVPIVVFSDADHDPLEDPGLTPAKQKALARSIFQRQWAERIAARHHVDAADVRHVIHNLDLSPQQRLRSAFRRARLRRRSPDRG